MAPNSEERRLRDEIKKSDVFKQEKEAKGISADKGAAARSMNLARQGVKLIVICIWLPHRLSLNVRQVLEAREGYSQNLLQNSLLAFSYDSD